jgi:transposase-like protein
MPPTRPPYSPEIRAAAVRQVLEERKSRRQTAAEAGVSRGTVGKWVRQAEIDAGDAKD